MFDCVLNTSGISNVGGLLLLLLLLTLYSNKLDLVFCISHKLMDYLHHLKVTKNQVNIYIYIYIYIYTIYYSYIYTIVIYIYNIL